VGIHGLDEAICALAAIHAHLSDGEAGEELLNRLGGRNYIPETARENYARAFAREYRRHLGQPVEPEEKPGLEIKVAGMGCPRCELLTQRVMRVLTEMGLAAEVEHVREAERIGQMGITLSPGLLINGRVVCLGRVPGEEEIRSWLAELNN